MKTFKKELDKTQNEIDQPMLQKTKTKILRTTQAVNLVVEALLMSFNVFYPIQVVAKELNIWNMGEFIAAL